MRLQKLLTDPIGVLQRRLRASRYRRSNGYDAEQYWHDRLAEYGMGLKGVGNYGLSEEENRQDYQQARETFLSVCREQKVDFANSRILEIGTGSGFYTRIVAENGGRDYTGADITDALFPALQKEFPAFRFLKRDAAAEELEGRYNLIIMIDVTQHITTDERFTFAMENVRTHLEPGGVFIVTSWLREGLRTSFYEVSRTMQAYEQAFPGGLISKPVPFRDKFLFTIRQQ